jgi:uncharacterized protein
LGSATRCASHQVLVGKVKKKGCLRVQFKVIEAITDIDAAAWNALLPEGAAPVCRWEWLDALESSGSASRERGWQAHHLTLWREGVLVAAAPAWLKYHSMGEYVYDFGWARAAEQMGVAYYPKMLVGLPLSPVTAPKFLMRSGENVDAVRQMLIEAAIAEAKENECSSVHALFPLEEELPALRAAGLYARSTLQFHWKNPGYKTYQDYLSRFDSKRRNQLKRERAAAAEQGIMLRTVRSQDIDSTHAHWAWKFYEATSRTHSWGPTQLNRGFFERVFANMPDAVEVVLAEHGKRVVAGAFNLHSPKRLYGRYWGCFEDFPFLHFHVCLYHSVDDAIAAGRAVFEPGAGGEHKISRGFEPTQVHSAHTVFHRRLNQAIEQSCEHEAQEIAKVTARSQEIAGMKPWP